MTQDNKKRVRLDLFLFTSQLTHSRSLAVTLIKAGKVLVNGGLVTKASVQVSIDDQIEILPYIATNQPSLSSYDFPLQIVYEDESLIVIDKPAGLPMHPAPGHNSDTLVNALIHHNVSLAKTDQEYRPGIVHRLDKDTSGLVVVAKTPTAHANLALAFQKRAIEREYLALCMGLFQKKEFRITSFLGRHPKDRKKFASARDLSRQIISDQDQPPLKGKWAATQVQIVKEFDAGATLCKVKLETGRTHQIRVHLSELNHPILGDTVYGKNFRHVSQQLKLCIESLNAFPRFFLHARVLGFKHPTSGKTLRFESPLPRELKYSLDLIENSLE